MSELSELAEAIEVTEERKTMLDLMHRRLTIDHSIVLHRDATSAADVKAMIAQLERAGMPPEATLKVDGTDNHTRVYGRWSEETA